MFSGPKIVEFQGFDRLPEREADRGLAREVIDFRGSGIRDDLQYAAEIRKAGRMQADAVQDAELLQIGEACELLVPGGAVNLVTLGQKTFRQVRAILPGYPEDQSFSCHCALRR